MIWRLCTTSIGDFEVLYLVVVMRVLNDTNRYSFDMVPDLHSRYLGRAVTLRRLISSYLAYPEP